ncbi:hypothetical protein BD779DRAFT_1536850 [Infundibulicybe gibba]|nr:hypothetical protein BD779DRAFT_1536850 [Infundibulicybe gibba]
MASFNLRPSSPVPSWSANPPLSNLKLISFNPRPSAAIAAEPDETTASDQMPRFP